MYVYRVDGQLGGRRAPITNCGGGQVRASRTNDYSSQFATGAGLQQVKACLCLARSERWLLRLRRRHSVDLLDQSVRRRGRGSHSLGSGRTQCTSFTRCGPPLCGKPACREGRDDCRGCGDVLGCSRSSVLCLSLDCGSCFRRRLSSGMLGGGGKDIGGLFWRLIL